MRNPGILSRYLICLALAPGYVAAQEQGAVSFRTGVSLVRVDVSVTDGSRPVSGLDPGDFLVRDNGAPQPVMHFARDEEPLDVMLLFDVSGSMDVKSQARGGRRGGDGSAIAPR